MSKQSAQDSQTLLTHLGFAGFWQMIATELGDCKLRINVNAASINQILAPTSDHREYLREIIRESYKRSRCQKLDDAVDLNAVLDILGETAFELQGQHADDLLDIELLEEIAYVISRQLSHHLDIAPRSQTDPKFASPAKIISLAKTRTLRANSIF